MKNKQALYLLFTANTIGGFAMGISMIAIPWYFINIYDKASLFGIIYFVLTGATLFWSLYAGVLIDQYNRKNIFLIINLLVCIVFLLAALSGFNLGYVPIYLIIIVFGFSYFIFNIHYPNLYAFAQEITLKKDYGKVNSYIEIQAQFTSVMAGALAMVLLTGTSSEIIDILGFKLHLGFIVKKWELHEIFLMNAIAYLFAFVVMLFIKHIPLVSQKAEFSNTLKRLKVGISFLRKHTLLFTFGNASFSIFAIAIIITFLLSPIYIYNHLQREANVYAASEMFFAIGAVLSGLGIRWIFKKTSTVMSIIIMLFVTALTVFTCVVNKNVNIFYLVMLTLGLCNAGARIMRITYLFNHIPNNIIGRVNSIFQTINILIRMFFILLFSLSFFSESNNIIYAYLIFGLFSLLSAIVLIFYYKKLVDTQ